MTQDEHEPNLYESRVRRWLGEYPYPLPTRDELTDAAFTPEGVAAALAEAYANHDARRRTWGYVLELCDRYFASDEPTEIRLIVRRPETR